MNGVTRDNIWKDVSGSRSVNRVCDLALLMGYALDRHEIGIEEVHTVLEESIIPIVP